MSSPTQKCPYCKKVLLLDSFATNARSAKKRKLNKCCQKCCAYVKSRHRKDSRLLKLRKLLTEFQKKACVDCGSFEFIEADHLPYAKKVRIVSDLCFWVSRGVEAFEAELGKCEPRCLMCHRLTTHWRRLKKKVHLELTKKYSQTAQAVSLRKRKARNRRYNNNQKRKVGECEICNLKCVAGKETCFDWDHLNRKTKIKGVTDFVRLGYSLKKISAEIEKCRLLCGICHTKHTRQQRDAAKNPF